MKAPRLPVRLTRWAAPALLAAGLAVSFGLAWQVQSGQEQRAGLNVSTLADNIGREIRNDIASYGTILRGLHGLFISSTDVDRDEFRQYVDLLRLQHDAALLQRFGFIERKGDTFVVKYVEPLAGNEALLGRDIAEQPATRDALARVMAGGGMTLSTPFRMERTAVGDTGLILILPLYASGNPGRPYAAAGRKTAALVGVTINLEKTLRGIAEPLAQRHVHFRITELERAWAAGTAEEGRPFFDSAHGAASTAPAWLTASRELEVLGNRWRLDLVAEPASMPPATRYAPQMALALSLTLTLLLFLLVHNLGRIGRLATAQAETMTKELRQSEEMFRDLAELSSDWFWEQDADFRYTAMSGGVVSKGSFRVEASLGKTRWELPIVGVSEDAWARHRTQLERHEPFRGFVYQIRAADGLLHWYEANGNPVFDADGRFAGYRGTGHDITRAKEAEQALRQSEARLNKAQAVARLGSWHLDITGSRLEWSRETYRLFGIAPGTPLTYDLFIERVHPDDRARVDRAWAAALQGEPYDIEHRIVANGETHWVHELAEIIFDAEGKAVAGTGTVLCITERKRAEQQLRLAANAFEHSLEGITITGGDGNILSVNRAFCEITGYRPEEVLGKNPRLLQSGRQGPDFYLAMWESIREKGYWRGEIWNRRKNGEIYPELLGICAVADDHGSPAHYIGMFTDISELKRSEAAMRQFNAELERRVDERTAALKASNRELEAFSYSVSHDLRAPLRGIDGFAHILAEEYADRLDDAAQGHLERIRLASQRMALVIDDMLELARLARIEPRREDLNLSALVKIVGEELPEEAGRRIELVIAPGVHALADPRLMHIVLQNLLHNAWKFTGRSEAAHIEFGEAAEAGERIFFVRDNGAGFDPAYSNKLFGAFQRLHRPDEFAGAGIGLATVQRIVQRHGGRVWAEGAVGQGATFYFTLG